MTVQEFKNELPYDIEHYTWGYAKLEIIADTKETKGACYRGNDKTASYGCYGKDWNEVYVKMRENINQNNIELKKKYDK